MARVDYEQDLEKQFKDIMDDYKKDLRKGIEDALTDAGNSLIRVLSEASPVGVYENPSTEQHFKDCWRMKTKYTGVRYIGNTKTVHDGIPLSQLIEFGSKGHPFIERTFELNKDKIYSDFVNKIKGGKV